MIGVFYSYHDYHKINGSLYYAFEYYQQLRLQTAATLYIINASNKDIEDIKKAFYDKYKKEIVDDIKICKITRTQIYFLKISKALFIDIRSYLEVKEFVPCEAHVFSNVEHDMYRAKKGTIYYGSYNYQNYDYYCILKLGLKFFKDIKRSKKGTFISTVNTQKIINYYNNNNMTIPEDVIYKSNDYIVDNLFEHINNIIYIHEQLDSNNRIIVESFWYGININIINFRNTIDSVDIRYNDCLNGNIEKYVLKNDVIINNLLKGK